MEQPLLEAALDADADAACNEPHDLASLWEIAREFGWFGWVSVPGAYIFYFDQARHSRCSILSTNSRKLSYRTHKHAQNFASELLSVQGGCSSCLRNAEYNCRASTHSSQTSCHPVACPNPVFSARAAIDRAGRLAAVFLRLN